MFATHQKFTDDSPVSRDPHFEKRCSLSHSVRRALQSPRVRRAVGIKKKTNYIALATSSSSSDTENRVKCRYRYVIRVNMRTRAIIKIISNIR